MELASAAWPGDTARAATTGEVQDLHFEARALKGCCKPDTRELPVYLSKSMIADGEAH